MWTRQSANGRLGSNPSVRHNFEGSDMTAAVADEIAKIVLRCMSEPVKELNGEPPIRILHPEAAQKMLRSSIARIFEMVTTEMQEKS
jgi:hypothetical protein